MRTLTIPTLQIILRLHKGAHFQFLVERTGVWKLVLVIPCVLLCLWWMWSMSVFSKRVSWFEREVKRRCTVKAICGGEQTIQHEWKGEFKRNLWIKGYSLKFPRLVFEPLTPPLLFVCCSCPFTLKAPSSVTDQLFFQHMLALGSMNYVPSQITGLAICWQAIKILRYRCCRHHASFIWHFIRMHFWYVCVCLVWKWDIHYIDVTRPEIIKRVQYLKEFL